MKAVIGLCFGDEGKGRVADFLDHSLTIRFSGGQQAGHGVIRDGKKHTFSNFGSSTLKGVPTYWSKFCTVDPVGMIKELDELIKIGINPLIYIDGNSPITTPHDKFHNKYSSKDLNHGTCGVGVGSTINREEHYYSLTFSDLFYPWILDFKLNAIKDYYNNIKYSDYASIGSMAKLLIPTEHITEFLESCYKLTTLANFKLTYGIPQDYTIMDEEPDILFEGSQGLLLDQWYGFFPHVARTNTGTKNIIDILGTDKVDLELYLVTRAYQTRHGNGPMTNEDIDFDIKIDPNETNVDGGYQGTFRRSVLDVSLLKYGIDKDKFIRESENKTLVITCLDHITEYIFTYNGKMTYCKNEKEFVENISNLLGIKKVMISHSPYGEIEKI